MRAEQAAEPTQGAAGLLQHVILDRDPLHTGEEDIFSAMQEGATSYLLRDSLFDDLATRIREVHTGEGRLPPAIETRLAERKHHKTLSPRERQIVELIAEGMRNKEIAAALGISEETVQVHMRHLLSKLASRTAPRC